MNWIELNFDSNIYIKYFAQGMVASLLKLKVNSLQDVILRFSVISVHEEQASLWLMPTAREII